MRNSYILLSAFLYVVINFLFLDEVSVVAQATLPRQMNKSSSSNTQGQGNFCSDKLVNTYNKQFNILDNETSNKLLIPNNQNIANDNTHNNPYTLIDVIDNNASKYVEAIVKNNNDLATTLQQEIASNVVHSTIDNYIIDQNTHIIIDILFQL